MSNQNLKRERKINNAEKQMTARNMKRAEEEKIGDEVEMRVVAIAGDPGLTEPWLFDILSGFVICMKEPVSRVPTNDKMWKMFYLVKRPRHLWTDSSGTPDTDAASDHSGTRRKDYFGNINIGNPSAYSIDTIPQLDTDYTIGQELTCRKVAREYAGQDNIFESIFSNTDFDNYLRDENTPRPIGGPHTNSGTRKGNPSEPYPTWKTEFVMEWSPKYWSSHGMGIAVAAGRASSKWHKLKPLIAARERFGGPVKAPRVADPKKMIAGGDYRGAAKNTPDTSNRSGARVGVSNPRFIGKFTDKTFRPVLHMYLIDSMLKEVHPSYSSTITALASKKHRYQQASGRWFCTKGGYYTQENCENVGGTWKSSSQTKNPKTGVPQDNYPLFDSKSRTHYSTNAAGGTVKSEIKEGDKEYINVNMSFGFVEWEDTNVGNKQRLSRDECMPLVIASPNNFPTPKERKLGALIYEPAYATVVAAQTSTGAIATPPSASSLEVAMVFNIIDNGVTALHGTGWVDAGELQKNVDRINELFSSNTPSTDITFTWDGTINSVTVPSSTSYSQLDDTCKTLINADDPEHQFNMWIIPCGGNAGDICGSWATFPTSHGNANDGVVMTVNNLVDGWSSVYGKGNILVHELGHYLGLYHIWGDGNCMRDDGITDTPNQDGPVYGCPSPAPASCQGSSTPVLIDNFMNYTSDDCTSNFTQGQIDRMEATLATVRKTLVD